MRTGIPTCRRNTLWLGVLVVAMFASFLAVAEDETEVLPAPCSQAVVETQDKELVSLEPALPAPDPGAVELMTPAGEGPPCRYEFCLVPGTRCTLTGWAPFGKKGLCCNYSCVSDPTCTTGDGSTPPNSCPVAIPPE